MQKTMLPCQYIVNIGGAVDDATFSWGGERHQIKFCLGPHNVLGQL